MPDYILIVEMPNGDELRGEISRDKAALFNEAQALMEDSAIESGIIRRPRGWRIVRTDSAYGETVVATSGKRD